MLTVLHLFSHSLFRNFTLLSDASGLYNPVTGTGIWDWESKEDIEATFSPGEFVLTTLSGAKDNIKAVDEHIKTLIDRDVAAIAIKNVHKLQISCHTINYANQHHIPIFIFTDTYIDDLIYTIKNALITNDWNTLLVTRLQEIMKAESSADVRTLACALNPFFKENCICCCCIPRSEESQEKAIDRYYEFYKLHVNSRRNAANAAHLLIKGKNCLFLIYTSASESSDLKNEILLLISEVGISERKFFLGLSLPKAELSLLDQALWEALYSAATCIMDHEDCRDYEDIGINQFLMPVAYSNWVRRFYTKFNDRLEGYDKEHNSNLQKTLIEYVKCGGDMGLAADRLYQHSNTIRYRLAKIKDILELKDKMESDIQMYIYVRLFDIYRNLQPDNLL